MNYLREDPPATSHALNLGPSARLPENNLPPPDSAHLSRLHLVVWFEYASTLAIFDRVGMLERELAIYRRLRPHLRALTLVTWSRGEDAAYVGALGDIGLLHNHHQWTWPVWMGIQLATFGFRFPGLRVLKTNQMSGAQHILRVARAWRTPLVARCGYPWSLFAARERGADDPVTREALATERAVFRGAARVVGSTAEIADLAIARDGVPAALVSVVPNYVDTDLMAPGPAPVRPRPRVGFLGRFERQKNPLTLIEAMAGIDAELVAVGAGSLRDAMAVRAAELGISLTMSGNLPHPELPGFFRSLDVFALPSLFEGHPKALLEAMACGLPVVGGDSPGIREVVDHGRTGLLAAPEPAAFRAAIAGLLADRARAAALGSAARAEIVAGMSLDQTVERELRVLSAAAAT
jgi:glycosyltransferase involved in cell wall biosynthesis